MDGLMQERPLGLTHLLERAEQLAPGKEIVTGLAGGARRRTYRQWATRCCQVGGALDALRIAPDARIGSFGWNTDNHLELYFGFPAAAGSSIRST